jgi:hypothetical protein
MSPTAPRKKPPNRAHQPTKRSEQSRACHHAPVGILLTFISEALLAAERAKTTKFNARQELKLRREQQRIAWEAENPAASAPLSPAPVILPGPSNKGKQRARSTPGQFHSCNFLTLLTHSIVIESNPGSTNNAPTNPASPPSTTRATVNVSIGAGTQDPTDEILEGVLAKEREWKAQLAWFAKHYPDWEVSTLDLEELVQLRHELGPGPTLPPNHNPYPNVRTL